MGRVITTGIDDLVAQLENTAAAIKGVGKYALYEGAGVMADAIREAAGGLPYKGSTVAQIQDAVGITKFKDTEDGSGTSIGFDGYFSSGKGKDGKPIAIQFFVREVEGGTSKIPAHPFVRRAAQAAQPAAEAAIVDAAERKIKQLTGGK